MHPRILIAGIGNIFLGDDAFGVEVVRGWLAERWPENVRVVDFGIRGFDLAMALLEDDRRRHPGGRGSRAAGRPARSTSSSPSWTSSGRARRRDESLLDPHALDPVKVLRLVSALGGRSGRRARGRLRARPSVRPTRIGTSRLA